jgi:hypothetical protein
MKRLTASLVVCFVGCLWGGVVFGAGAVPDLMSGQSSVSFAAQGLPFPEKQALQPNDAILPGMFIGDYTAAAIKGVGCVVQSVETPPSFCVLYFYSAVNNREWRHTVALDGAPASVVVTAPFEFDQWTLWDSGATPEMFAADLQTVDRIGVRFLRNGTGAQTYKGDKFMLLAGSSFDLARSLYEFMLAKGLLDANADNDSDGLSNWGEFVAGTDPTEANSTVALRIELVDTPKGVALKWTNNPECKYAVWRGTVPGEFERVTPEGEWLESGDSEIQVPAPAPEPGAGPYFYKVEISRK